MKRPRILYAAALLALPFLLLPFFKGGDSSFASVDSAMGSLSKIKSVLDVVRELYVEPADMEALTDGAIRGLLEELDPHSAYIPASELQEVTEDFKGEFEGIGIYFVIRDKRLTVVSAIPGTPSDRLGLGPGDVIVAIEGQSTFGITNEDVQRKLKGPKGTEVEITVRRQGLPDELVFRIVREKIPIKSVESAFLLKGGVGYVALNRFMATSEGEVRAAVDRLLEQGMTKLVFDLRNNAGGYLDQARRIADLFLEGGQTIVSTEGRRPEFNEIHRSTDDTTLPPLPLIVLINQGSASASEIIAGAMQDLDRGLIAGQTSFGKGLVQRQLELHDGSALRVTIARYFTPSHRLIQRPYDKGLAEYYAEAFDELDPNLVPDSTQDKPAFLTRAGRTVYGGGGITPDVRIRSGRLTPYTVRLRVERSFFDFANEEGPGLRPGLESLGREAFVADWQPDEALLERFVAFSSTKVELDAEAWSTDLHWIRGYLKQELARVVFDRETSLRVGVGFDPTLVEALLLFDEAERIQGLASR